MHIQNDKKRLVFYKKQFKIKNCNIVVTRRYIVFYINIIVIRVKFIIIFWEIYYIMMYYFAFNIIIIKYKFGGCNYNYTI